MGENSNEEIDYNVKVILKITFENKEFNCLLRPEIEKGIVEFLNEINEGYIVDESEEIQFLGDEAVTLIVALKQTSEVYGLTTLPRGCESIYIAISCMIGQVVKESDTSISMDDFKKLSCSLVTDNFIFYRNKEECDDMRLYDRDMALFKKGSFVSTEFMLELERIVRKESQVYYMDSETLYTLQYFLA